MPGWRSFQGGKYQRVKNRGGQKSEGCPPPVLKGRISYGQPVQDGSRCVSHREALQRDPPSAFGVSPTLVSGPLRAHLACVSASAGDDGWSGSSSFPYFCDGMFYFCLCGRAKPLKMLLFLTRAKNPMSVLVPLC